MATADAALRRRPAHGRAGARAGAAPQTAPLQGAELVLGTIALSLATFMNVLDTSIANVSIPAISGDLGVSPSQGTWVITSFAVANAISVPLTGWLTQRFGPVRLFVGEHPAVRDRLVAVRPGAEHRHADRVPRPAGLRRRADDPALADAAAVELSARQGGHGDGDVGDDGAGRAGRRAAARRLDHRQHLVAVDLLHQHPGRPDRGRGHLVDLSQARPGLDASRRSTTSAWRCSCSGSARCRS